MDVLRRRLPPEAGAWLDDVLAREDWASLAACAHPGMADAEAETRMLQAAVAWAEARMPADETDGPEPEDPEPPGKTGG